MPVSKRDKKVSLTKTPKKGMKLKQQLIEKIRSQVEKYNSLYVFTTYNMRNAPLKDVREEWKDSRFFFAKKKVMAIALGRTEAEESEKNLHKLAGQLKGQCGLLFTNKPKDQVVQWFKDFSKMDFARSGFIATETVKLPAGPQEDFPSAIEPHLRKLGLPTSLEKGKVMLREKYVVCNKGAKITPEQADVLKLYGKRMAEFKITLACMWCKDGSFEKFKIPKELQKSSKVTESPRPKANTPGEATEIPKEQQTPSVGVTKTPNQKPQTSNKDKTRIPNATPETPEEEAVIETKTTSQEIPKTLKMATKTLKSTPKPTAKAHTEESETSERMEMEASPKPTVKTIRRSMRTPKPIRRTPEQTKVSVKKLTQSAKKLNLTPKQTVGTPKTGKASPWTVSAKRVSRARQQPSEDVEMAE